MWDTCVVHVACKDKNITSLARYFPVIRNNDLIVGRTDSVGRLGT